MSKIIIRTDAAPRAIGAYSQAVRHADVVYLSGQIPLDPTTGEVVGPDVEAQIHQVFRNLRAVVEAAGGNMAGLLKLNVYLADLGDFAKLNEIMAQYVPEPFPARAAVQVSALPRGVRIEIDGVLGLS